MLRFLLLACLGFGLASASIVFELKEDTITRTVFEHDPERNSKFSNNPYIPSACPDGEDFCEDADDYPDRQVLRNIRSRNKISELELNLLFVKRPKIRNTTEVPEEQMWNISSTFAGRSSVQFNPNLDQDGDEVTAGRIQNQEYPESDMVEEQIIPKHAQSSFGARTEFTEESPVCKSHVSYIYPKKAKNTNNEMRFLWSEPSRDGDSEYLAQIKVERCTNDEMACDIETVAGIETVCKQKYSEKRLLAISPQGTQYVDTFRTPSCCICYVRKTTVLERMGTINSGRFGAGFSRGGDSQESNSREEFLRSLKI